jgi:hypothetical protein
MASPTGRAALGIGIFDAGVNPELHMLAGDVVAIALEHDAVARRALRSRQIRSGPGEMKAVRGQRLCDAVECSHIDLSPRFDAVIVRAASR